MFIVPASRRTKAALADIMRAVFKNDRAGLINVLLASLPKTHPHELMVKTSTGDRHVFCFGRDDHRCVSVQDTAASGGISRRLSITSSTKPKSFAISAVRK